MRNARSKRLQQFKKKSDRKQMKYKMSKSLSTESEAKVTKLKCMARTLEKEKSLSLAQGFSDKNPCIQEFDVNSLTNAIVNHIHQTQDHYLG